MQLSVGFLMCVQVSTEARKGQGPPGAEVTSSCGCGAEAELGCFGYPQGLQSSLWHNVFKESGTKFRILP